MTGPKMTLRVCGLIVAALLGVLSYREIVSAATPDLVIPQQSSSAQEVTLSAQAFGPLASVRPSYNNAAFGLKPTGLEPIALNRQLDGRVVLAKMPQFSTITAGRVAGITSSKDFVFYTLEPDLQRFVREVVRRAASPHVAVVAMDPYTGKVLALADKSSSIPELSLHAGFPAASIFKLVTAAAALEKSTVSPYTTVRFRGGTYTLERWNYYPDARRDRRSMTLSEALGRSCNPVFARIALANLSPSILRQYANAFGFNGDVHFDTLLRSSKADIPDGDEYEMGRAAAGFGQVTLSPIHAAALMSGIANGGMLVRPSLIASVRSATGKELYTGESNVLKRIIQPQTSARLLEMMEYTTTIGTTRREFARREGTKLAGMEVAAKTGTLRGADPEGINHWFLAAAPLKNPRIAISVISVNPSGPSGKASHIGRLVLEKFFGAGDEIINRATDVYRKKSHSKTKYRKKSKKKTSRR